MCSKEVMHYGQWCHMSTEQQEEYLRVNGLEVQGYTITGQNIVPDSIEFAKVEIVGNNEIK